MAAHRPASVTVSHCFAEHGKSRSNIFHISSPSGRIEMNICCIYPQTTTVRARHRAVHHSRSRPPPPQPLTQRRYQRAKVARDTLGPLRGRAVIMGQPSFPHSSFKSVLISDAGPVKTIQALVRSVNSLLTELCNYFQRFLFHHQEAPNKSEQKKKCPKHNKRSY